MTSCWRIALLMLLGCCRADVSAGQTEQKTAAAAASTVIVVSSNVDGLGPDQQINPDLGVEIILGQSGSRFYNVGARTHRAGDTTWTYGRLGVLKVTDSRTSIHAQIDLGGWTEAGRMSSYIATQLVASRQVTHLFTATLKHRFARAPSLSGHLVEAASSMRFYRQATVTGSLFVASSPLVQPLTGAFRVDVPHRQSSFFGGWSASAAQRFLASGPFPATLRGARNGFAGTDLPLNVGRLVMAVTAYRTTSYRRFTVSAAYVLPWR